MELKSQWTHCGKELVVWLMGAARREISEIIFKVYTVWLEEQIFFNKTTYYNCHIL